MENAFLYFIKGLAIASQLLHLAIGAAAIFFCVTLFRRERSIAWLLIGAIFLEPIARSIMRVLRGGTLLAYKSDRAMEVSYNLHFPVLYFLAVAGLFMLVRNRKAP